MKRIFVGGSRQISHLNDEVRRRLDQIIERRLCVFVGDANGADKEIQRYFQDNKYPNVVVFCTGTDCRNNLGGWQVRSVKPPHKNKDFAYFSAKDMVMAHEADVGLMLWDNESAGTIVNVARLLATGKIISLYVSSEKSFFTLRTQSDLERILSVSPREVKMRLDRYIASHVQEYAQSALF